MKRVVVTGLGIVSSIGNNAVEVLNSLKNAKSGIVADEKYKQMGFRSQVCGQVNLNINDVIDRKKVRFMGDASGFAYVAMGEAIESSGLSLEEISHPDVGIITGSGGGSNKDIVESADIAREKRVKFVGPYRVTRAMSNTTSACLGTFYAIKGINYSISSACATSAHCIGNAYEQIQMGKQKIIFAGGAEEVHWTMSVNFDAMGALSSNFNDTPETASRAFDVNRDGFVISGGAGILVVEELEHAKKRGAKIYAEITGYGATSDGYDMVQPSGEGGLRCMSQALKNVNGDIEYINAHGTSTPVGDIQEIASIKKLFGAKIPKISSTKSLTGHALGAAGVNEAIYTLLMMKNNFLVKSANIDTLDPQIENVPILRETIEAKIKNAMSNSFGFGGTNACLVFSKI